LSQIGQDTIQWNEAVNSSFSPKKIRYPLCVMSFYFCTIILFLGLYALGRTRFYATIHQIFEARKATAYILTAVIFLLIAFFYTAGRLGSSPWKFIDLQSDAANIASFAAAYAHPENFSRDPFLSNPANYQGYFALHVPLIQGLGNLFGNYATAFTVLLFPTILVTLAGYYILGLKLFKNRLLAFLLSFVTIFPISLPVYEYYGLSGDILPRSLFQALLPYALFFLLQIINKPKRWWLCSLLFTLLFYVHPVSGPSWLLALYFSFALIMLLQYRHIFWKPFFVSIFLSIVGLIPFVRAFFVPSGNEVIDIPLIKEIMAYRLSSQTVNVIDLYSHYIESQIMPHSTVLILWIINLLFFMVSVGLIIHYLITKKDWFTNKPHLQTAVLIFAWWTAILFASIGIPLLDEYYTNATGNLPVLREIRRNLRYFIPLLWITLFWIIGTALAWTKQLKNNSIGKSLQTNLLFFAMLLAGAYLYQVRPFKDAALQNGISCLRKGKLFCDVTGNTVEKLAFYDNVSTIVQPKELIFPDPSPVYLGDTLIPRYYCIRSVAYTYKDGSSAGNSSMSFIKDWWKISQDMEKLLPTNDAPLNLEVLQIANDLNANYFIFINPDPHNLTLLNPDKIIYQNNYGVLYKLP
nr:hypothetical protein [Anaerolineaceae bacterium]